MSTNERTKSWWRRSWRVCGKVHMGMNESSDMNEVNFSREGAVVGHVKINKWERSAQQRTRARLVGQNFGRAVSGLLEMSRLMANEVKMTSRGEVYSSKGTTSNVCVLVEVTGWPMFFATGTFGAAGTNPLKNVELPSRNAKVS
jgi:hypothetical protein